MRKLLVQRAAFQDKNLRSEPDHHKQSELFMFPTWVEAGLLVFSSNQEKQPTKSTQKLLTQQKINPQ